MINKMHKEQMEKAIEDIILLVTEYSIEIKITMKNIGLDETYK